MHIYLLIHLNVVPAQGGIVLDTERFTEMSEMYLPLPLWSLQYRRGL